MCELVKMKIKVNIQFERYILNEKGGIRKMLGIDR